MNTLEDLFQYTVELLKQLSVRHEFMRFSSGAVMLDAWYNDKFYVFQFEKDHIGISEISEDNIGLDTIPDRKFIDRVGYLKELKRRLKLD